MSASPSGGPSPNDLRSWGIDPAWSRTIEVPSHDGATHGWHLLDTATPHPEAVVLCVHGNPTWAASWVPLLERLATTHRLIAVDQLSMGFSDLVAPRGFAERVADLDDVIAELRREIPDLGAGVPLVLAGHDWGGAIAMGWAVEHSDQLAGLMLCNTGIEVPAGRRAPGLIRLAAAGPLRDLVCRRTRIFVDGTIMMSRRRLDSAQRAALRAPYRTTERRRAIADFVGDIPLRDDHPSASRLAAVAERLRDLDVPVLLAWGSADPVFNDDFRADLAARMPHAVQHRIADCGHLVVPESATSARRSIRRSDGRHERRDVAEVAALWLTRLAGGADADDAAARQADHRPRPRDPWSVMNDRPPNRPAFVDLGGGRITWGQLTDSVQRVTDGLRAAGLGAGDRVAVVTPPGVDLVAVVYGIWRAGGVTVIADRGLGVRGIGAALRGARPTWIVGPRHVLATAKLARWAPRATALDVTRLVAGHVRSSTTDGTAAADLDDGDWPDSDAPAAVLFTSGATGPAKGVRYTHGQLLNQLGALTDTYAISEDDSLVAAFAPFALYGPALGVTTALPAVDVTRPASLTHDDLRAACDAVDATLLFASPAALANVVRTARPPAPPLHRLRVVMSAGAPVAEELLADVGVLAPAASLHTPYGMTEVLPVADIDLAGIIAAGADDPAGGVCVGTPVAGAEVRVETIPAAQREGLGEVVVRSPWVSAGYAELWGTQQAARPGQGWHRTGDVGHLDTHGRLWIEGRRAHLIGTSDGVLGPIPLERIVERACGLRRAAAVGVGPWGRQQIVIVIEEGSSRHLGLATRDIAARVRGCVAETAGHRVAAVLSVAALPVDVRHNSKIDRTAVARKAGTLLSGASR